MKHSWIAWNFFHLCMAIVSRLTSSERAAPSTGRRCFLPDLSYIAYDTLDIGLGWREWFRHYGENTHEIVYEQVENRSMRSKRHNT